MSLLDKIIAYESMELDEELVVELFQELIDTGTIWSLQGSYQRQAQHFINTGQCTA